MIPFIILTDLDYPDDESSLHLRADLIGDFREVKHPKNDQFATVATVVNMTYGQVHLVCESAVEVRERMLDAFRIIAEAEESEAEEERTYLDPEEFPELLKALGLDDATLESELVIPDLQHTLAAEG